MKTYHKVLTIAGSDSCGGAGIQADIKTFSALGCYGMSVITALTAQNTQGVVSVHAVPPVFVADQLEAVLTDVGVDAVKIGMLFSVEIIEAVADGLSKHEINNIVLDPVMVAQSGDPLMQEDAVNAVRELLVPLATVVTPNLPEAGVLLKMEIHSIDDMKAAASKLAESGAESVLIKGGHMKGETCVDILVIASEDRTIELAAPRLKTRNNHGTGCTLSSAIAAFLAKGLSLENAVKKAKEFLTRAIQEGAGYEIGKGHGPVHHFYEYWG